MPDTVLFNDDVRLIVADVDHTVAETYTAAEPGMITELSKLLSEGRVLFFVTGGSLDRVQKDIVDYIAAPLRKGIIVAHCSGAEVWGYTDQGALRDQAFYTLYDDAMDETQKKRWRELVHQLIEEFHLETHETMPEVDFIKKYGTDPLTIMLSDRGPQITFEIKNGYDLTPEQEEALEIAVPATHGALDLRIPILERADELFRENNIPVTPRLGGMAALDFALKGVSKTKAVQYFFDDDTILQAVGLSKEILANPHVIEIWGDRFDRLRGGTDRHMQEAVSKEVRAIDFRHEDPENFLSGYNTVLWNGEKQLQHGLLEYLTSRS
jgi:hydroxymethylpyrimidine pyrophosphatase-like HAD family hydrolase